MGRPHPRPATGSSISSTSSIAAALSIVALAALTGCPPSTADSIDLSGRWQSELDGSVLSIEPSGLFTLEIPEQKMVIVGNMAVDGTRVTFRNRPETKICVGDEGIYEMSVDSERLVASEVRDTCQSRSLHMTRGWRRLPPATNDQSAPK